MHESDAIMHVSDAIMRESDAIMHEIKSKGKVFYGQESPRG